MKEPFAFTSAVIKIKTTTVIAITCLEVRTEAPNAIL